MSNYMQIKADIEALEKQRDDLTRTLEAARVAELEAECTDIKKRIIAFGIEPSMLFGPDELKGKRGPKPRSGNHPFPVKFKHRADSWTGTGAMPKWFAHALREGVKPEAMLVPGVALGRLPKGAAELMSSNGARK